MFPKTYFSPPYYGKTYFAEDQPPNQFLDDFSVGLPLPQWAVRGGTWSVSSGLLNQYSTNTADPKKLVLVDKTYPADLTIRARLRVDRFTSGDSVRAGLSVRTGVADGLGYNLVLRNPNGTPTVQFLDDMVKWGTWYPFAWQTGVWYWMSLQAEGTTLRGKVWADGTPEPATWPFVQTGWTNRTSGAPAINGSSTGSGNASVSFDTFAIL